MNLDEPAGVLSLHTQVEVMPLIGSDEHGRAKYLHNGAATYRIA